VGIKTGYTDDAGHCLLFEAARNGRTLIGVVLDSPPTGPAAAVQDAGQMLNWGFGLHQQATASPAAQKLLPDAYMRAALEPDARASRS
jgi:D-alanyl-D-alanine carboxypeptidase